jgi:uncharacterized membrane protein YqhA
MTGAIPARGYARLRSSRKKRMTREKTLVTTSGTCAMKNGDLSMGMSVRAAGEPSLTETYHERRLLRLLATSRYLIGIAVVGIFLGATALLAYGVLETFALVRAVLAAWLPAVVNSADLPPLLAGIAAVDAFLVAVVLYFIAVGLYQLSFHPLPLPEWLLVHDLDELEDKLAQVVVVVLGIAFLGQVVTWDGKRDLLGFGIATALVIGALSFHLRRVPAEVSASRRNAP